MMKLSPIIDPDVYTSGVPHDVFKDLRDNDPVSWTREQPHEDDGGQEGAGFWSITRYADIIEASRQPKIFSSAKGIRIEDMAEDELIARTTMMELDPPLHTNYRRMVSNPFHRKEMKNYEPDLRKMAVTVIEEAMAKDEFDFTLDIARQLPMRMLGKLLGIPDKDGPWLVAAGDALIGNSDPEFTEFVVDQVDTEEFRLLPFRSPVSLKLFDFAGKMAAEKSACPMHDVTSDLLKPNRDGEVLSDLDFKNFFTLLVAAGNDTTRYTMAAGMQALLDNPDQLELLRARPELIDSAVEEILRWGTVTMHFRRTLTQDYEMGGKTLKAGDRAVLWFISGDYDERQFKDPFKFDITRTPNEHLAFGLKTPHKCLGEHLARWEIKVLFEELIPRMKHVESNGPIDLLRSNFITGIKHLPIKVDWV
ncbi:MAG: cytochrome P450 [Anaerolineae bacterium]